MRRKVPALMYFIAGAFIVAGLIAGVGYDPPACGDVEPCDRSRAMVFLGYAATAAVIAYVGRALRK